MLFRFFLICLTLAVLPVTGWPASLLEYQVTRGGQKSVQTVNIQDGLVWITAAGGDANTDVLFASEQEQLVLVDHRRQRYTPVNPASLQKLTGQVANVTPLLRGLGDQINRLPPAQQAQWERLLGGFPLDAFEKIRQEVARAELKPEGAPKTIARIRCQPWRLSAGQLANLSVCLAAPGALGLTDRDADTLKALVRFIRQVAGQAHGLASPWGIAISQAELDQVEGIPLQLRLLKDQQPLSMTLQRASQAKGPLTPLRIPDNYQAETLRLW